MSIRNKYRCGCEIPDYMLRGAEPRVVRALEDHLTCPEHMPELTDKEMRDLNRRLKNKRIV